VNNRRKIAAVAKYLKECLLEKEYMPQLAHQTVCVYTSHVSKYGQGRLYNTFYNK